MGEEREHDGRRRKRPSERMRGARRAPPARRGVHPAVWIGLVLVLVGGAFAAGTFFTRSTDRMQLGGGQASDAPGAAPNSAETCSACSGWQRVPCMVCHGGLLNWPDEGMLCGVCEGRGFAACSACRGRQVTPAPTAEGLARFLEQTNDDSLPPHASAPEVLEAWQRGELEAVVRLAHGQAKALSLRAFEEAMAEEAARGGR